MSADKPIEVKRGEKATFKEKNRTFSMEVQADEGQFGPPDEEMDQDLRSVGGNSDQENESEDDSDSVKILPLTAEQKLQQLEDIDNEMYDKLTELKEVLSQTGMKKSLQYINKYLLGESGSPPRQNKPPVHEGAGLAPNSSTVEPQLRNLAVNPLPMEELTGISNHSEWRSRPQNAKIGRNTNDNHKKRNDQSLKSSRRVWWLKRECQSSHL